MEDIILKLYDIILQRKKDKQQGSYTAYLFDEGIDKILKKCGEEMTEVIIAAKNKDKHELTDETSDLLYHLLVMLNNEGISLQDVENKLEERHGEKQEYSIRDEIQKW